MEVITWPVPPTGRLIDTNDWHLGSINCHMDGIIGMRDRCVRLNKGRGKCYMVTKGDLMETIAPSDKRYNIHDRDLNLKIAGDQRDAIIDLLWPVKKYLLAVGAGNHELKDQNTVQYGKEIAERLGVPYGAYNFVIEFINENTGKLMFKGFFSHGFGTLRSQAKDKIQRDANRKASLKQKLINTRISDCIYMSMGHTHQLLIVPPVFDIDTPLTTSPAGVHQHQLPPTQQNSKHIDPDRRFYVNAGSFLKLYAPSGSGAVTYGEMRGLEPSDLGWVEMIWKDERVIDVKAHKLIKR